MTIEELAKKIFIECEKDGEPVTEEESLEIAGMELKANKDCKQYVSSEKKTQKKKPQKKVDEVKKQLLMIIAKGLNENNINYTKDKEKALHFEYNNENYTINLVRHTKKNSGNP